MKSNREGTSLVELLVAMTLLGVVLTSLAGLTFDTARRSIVVAGNGYMQGVVTEQINRLEAIPFSQLPAAAGCMTVANGVFPHRRCITVTDVNSIHRLVRMIVQPGQLGLLPDTVDLVRWNPPAINPLFTP
ncbi:MAG: type IV pilus modification PilV family protein [Longimicrobiales bacterium]